MRYRLYSDMRKYGIENFEISEIEKVDNPNILSDREKYWVGYYDTYYNGYNNTLGGDGGLLYDYDQIWKLWENNLKIKEIAKIIDCNEFVVRTVLDIHNVSTEERIDRSYDDQVNSHKKYQREVEQLDINTGEVIHKYQSVSDAARSVGCDNSQLSKICKNAGIAKGFRWRYTNNSYVKKDFSARQVCKIDLKTNEIIDIYPSISEAARSVGGDSSYISRVCKGEYKSSKGFGWKYMDS